MSDENKNDLRARAQIALERSLARNSTRSEVPVDPALIASLSRALKSLPTRTRDIFLAHRVDDMPYREIAAEFSLNVEAVTRHMIKAIRHLDHYLRYDIPPLSARRWRYLSRKS